MYDSLNTNALLAADEVFDIHVRCSVWYLILVFDASFVRPSICAFRDLLKLLSPPLQPSAGVVVTTAAAVGGIFVIIPYLYAVVKTRSLSFLVSSSAALAAATANPSSFPGRTGFGGGRKKNTEGTLPFIN